LATCHRVRGLLSHLYELIMPNEPTTMDPPYGSESFAWQVRSWFEKLSRASLVHFQTSPQHHARQKLHTAQHAATIYCRASTEFTRPYTALLNIRILPWYQTLFDGLIGFDFSLANMLRTHGALQPVSRKTKTLKRSVIARLHNHRLRRERVWEDFRKGLGTMMEV
jgi:hypothetical protein